MKAWECTPQRGAPELLVISAGPLEDNRKQGFRSTRSAKSVFRSRPGSAVVVDEEGRVASEVGVGAPDVLAMSRAVSSADRSRSNPPKVS